MTREEAIEALQQNNNDIVSRKAILSKIYEVCFSDKWLQFRVDQGSRGQRNFIIDYIKNLPTIESGRKTAKWKTEYAGCYYDTCSECGQRVTSGYFKFNYCPNCGAKMVSEELEKNEKGDKINERIY